MKDGQLWIFAIGFFAQLLFSARMIIQWIVSEKAGKSLSPTFFWYFSLLGSMVFLIYGILRKDFAIVFGQFLVYYIYIRNLQFKQKWQLFPRGIRWIILLSPLIIILYFFFNYSFNIFDVINNKTIPLWLKIWGTLGQIIFTLRFYVQWLDSESKKESVLSLRFWLLSLTGSLMIISYAILRLDPVLFLGQFLGLLIYARNLMFFFNLKSR